MTAESILQLKNLRKYFPIRQGMLGRVRGHVRAVDDVNLSVHAGETLGLVGESGSGKTTLGRSIVRAHAPTDGQILYRRADDTSVDLAKLSRKELRPYRRELRMIFQDPFSSLNPRMTVMDIVGEPLRIHGLASGRVLEERVAHTLERVGLRPEVMRRYPHAFSGGQRQRIGIARAIVLDSRLVVADEAVSALDVSVRAQILKLLQSLKRQMNLTYLFISHDLSVVEYIADRVAVMYVGKVVELAGTEALYHRPMHPYTEALMSAVPNPDPTQRSKRVVLSGEIPDPANPPSGCHFHPRCPYAQARCKTDPPELREVAPGRLAACHFAEQLSLRGAGER
ncbi:MAG: ATP-binding cassette domain-containing protein [Chloroflexi bacterium]|nr:ATP-binding cassette domain-containing protein [Chloroflexota bacterium]MBV9896444.1 ATP-binding cassette domain-containing protein [Chloroflexota bacterium]